MAAVEGATSAAVNNCAASARPNFRHDFRDEDLSSVENDDFVANGKSLSTNSSALMNDNDSFESAQGDLHDKSGGIRGGVVPPPRDSGIGLGVVSSSFHDEEEDILDLDRFGEMDDEESWLYSTPAAKKTENIVSWLHKDIDSLDYSTRRALATKLEFILKHKKLLESCENEENDASVATQSKSSRVSAENGDDSPSSISRRKTFKLDKSSVDSATYVKPAKKQTTPATKSVDLINQQQRKLTPTLTFSVADEDSDKLTVGPVITGGDNTSSNSTSSGRRSLDEMLRELSHKQPDINPDLKDIRLLASMQEQDLRQCLQQLQLAQSHRRRTSSDRHEIDAAQTTKTLPPQQQLNTPPVPYTVVTATPQGNVSAASSARPSSAGSHSPRGAVSSSASGDEHSNEITTTTPKSVRTLRHPSDTVVMETGGDLQPPSVGLLLIGAQKAGGFQKSMPNLAGSKSCDALKQEVASAMSASTSEKGSCGDIPAVHGGNTNSTPSIQKETGARLNVVSRLPTPRSRLPTPARSITKSAIPAPRFSTPTPLKKGALPQRKVNASESSSSQDESWKSGCI